MQRQRAADFSNAANLQPGAGSAAFMPYVCPVVFALIFPILVGLSKPPALELYSDLLYVFIWLLPAAVIARIVYDWRARNEAFVICVFRFMRPLKYLENLPAEVIFKADHKKLIVPWVTLILTAGNVLIYYCVSDEVARKFVFTPWGDPSVPDILISVFTHAFLHANTAHLYGNMSYLLVFGSLVESKIGSIRFFTAYLICLLTSTFADIVMLAFMHPDYALLSILKNFHSRGASGAISGIMGLFVVRCFFARFQLCSPFFSLPVLSLPIGICGTLLCTSFFAFDISGSLKMLETGSRIAYWAHLGGYIGGFFLGYCLRLHRESSREIREMDTEVLNYKRMIKKGGRLHVAALKFLLEQNINNPKKSAFYYVRLVRVLARSDLRKAIKIFLAYYPKHAEALPGNILLDIGLHFFWSGDLLKAETCLRLSSDLSGPWQIKAKLYLLQTLNLKQKAA
jgi:membrane associated rhomboid family serine protease